MINPELERPRRSPEGRRPIVVLLVDDRPFVTNAITQLLATETDIELHCCRRAADATARANQIAPTVILQDLVMLDGFTLVRTFRTNPMTARTPVIALSGSNDSATRARALSEGASDCLVKLPAGAELIACIRRHTVHDPDGMDATPDATTTPRVVEETLDLCVVAAARKASSRKSTADMIDRFIEEAESQVQTLRDATNHRDRRALNATAHRLKDSSLGVGARRLAALCARVEDHLAVNPDCVVTSGLLTEVEEEFGRVREALSAER